MECKWHPRSVVLRAILEVGRRQTKRSRLEFFANADISARPLLVISGAFKDGAVTMEGEMHLRNGNKVLQRITWKIEGDGVREFSVRSKDGGKTWEPFFDVLFKKRK